MGRIVGLILLLFSGLSFCRNQAVAQVSSPAVGECDYAACALRVRGGAVLAGEKAVEVGRFGFFSSPEVRPLMEASDSAAYHFSVVEGNHGSGQVMSLIGVVSLFLSPLAIGGWEGSAGEWIGYGMLIGGGGLFWSGNRRLGTARRAMADAIWWYNSTLVSAPPTGPR